MSLRLFAQTNLLFWLIISGLNFFSTPLPMVQARSRQCTAGTFRWSRQAICMQLVLAGGRSTGLDGFSVDECSAVLGGVGSMRGLKDGLVGGFADENICTGLGVGGFSVSVSVISSIDVFQLDTVWNGWM